MTGTNTRLTTAVESYFADLRRVRASGGATGERSSYTPLANLLNAVGATLKPKVFCVGELADQGAGHPDFGLYTRLLHKLLHVYVTRRRSVLREHVGALFRVFRCCSWRGSTCRQGERCARRIG